MLQNGATSGLSLSLSLSFSLSTTEGSLVDCFPPNSSVICRFEIYTISHGLFTETERVQSVYYIKPHYVCRVWPRGCETGPAVYQEDAMACRNLRTYCVISCISIWNIRHRAPILVIEDGASSFDEEGIFATRQEFRRDDFVACRMEGSRRLFFTFPFRVFLFLCDFLKNPTCRKCRS